MNILEELWYGQVSPAEARSYRQTELGELVTLLERNEKQLLPSLNEEERKKLQNINDLREEIERVGECDAFIKGFRLAVQLMCAAV